MNKINCLSLTKSVNCTFLKASFSRALATNSTTGTSATPNVTPNAAQKSEPETPKPAYMTAHSYKEKYSTDRFNQKVDASHGIKPTTFQKNFLVLTRMFKKKQDIPEYISQGTINRMHDRGRALYIVGGCLFFFLGWLSLETTLARRIENDKRVAQMSTMQTHQEEQNRMKPRERNTGVPHVPVDIGYDSGNVSGGSHKTGVMDSVVSNPFVPIGMGLTTVALLGMFKSSLTGDKLGTQKYMRYRILAQFATVIAMVGGLAIAGMMVTDKMEKEELKQK
uniref:HIG1 domain-containing protein n=1 Tax=Rhabditophanes sp. KR3021 TaxID=114890 RepID=A0AC35UBN9_9BILA